MSNNIAKLLFEIRKALNEEQRNPRNTKIVMGCYLADLISSDLKNGNISENSYWHLRITLYGYPVQIDYLNNLKCEIVSNTYIDAEKILNYIEVETPSER